MKFFTESEVAELLPMDEALAAVEASLWAQSRRAAANHSRRRLAASGGVLLHAMEAAVELDGHWYLGFKMYSTSRQGAHSWSVYTMAPMAGRWRGSRPTGWGSAVPAPLPASPPA